MLGLSLCAQAFVRKRNHVTQHGEQWSSGPRPGAGGPHSRDRLKPVIPPDMSTPDLDIDTVKVKSKNVQ